MQPPKKGERMEAFIRDLGDTSDLAHDPCYLGYFACFNEGRYYEAHDVLEHLWLQGRDGNYAYFKGLIQLAGAFVHLRKQWENPDHPTHGRRLRPAARLFRLAATNLAPYAPRHMDLDVAAVCEFCGEMEARIVGRDFSENPWDPDHAPRLQLGG